MTKNDVQDQSTLNTAQKYCWMLQREHSAILSTFIKLSVVIKTFILSIFEWPLYTDFTVLRLLCSWCHNAVCILCLFLAVPWVGLRCLIEAFPGHTHLLFEQLFTSIYQYPTTWTALFHTDLINVFCLNQVNMTMHFTDYVNDVESTRKLIFTS